jgi:hypothetical protein
MVEARAIPEFTELVKEHLDKGNHNSPSKEHVCLKCVTRFETVWELQRHESQSHKNSVSRTISKSHGKYCCRICSIEESSIYALKRHMFRYHSDIDVRATYALTVEKYIGKYDMNTLRQSTYTKIEGGRFFDFVEEILSLKEPFKINSINWDFLVSVDIDPINAEKRRLFYHKKRDYCLKLAAEDNSIVDGKEPYSRDVDSTSLKQYIEFDLTMNFYKEKLPDDIIRCIKYARISSREEQKYLPKFLGFIRNGMAAQLQLSKEPVMLRQIIGDRACMYRMGP